MSIESMKKDMHSVEISVGDEILLCRLLGQSMLYIHGRQSQKIWKRRILNKLTKVIERSIKQNVISDRLSIPLILAIYST